jgi:hypothetical protein
MNDKDFFDNWIFDLRTGFHKFLESNGENIEKLSRKEILDKRRKFELEYFHAKNNNSTNPSSDVFETL